MLKKFSSWIFICLPIVIWSSSAVVVKYNILASEGIYVAYFSILFASIFSFIFTFFKAKKHFEENLEIIKSNPKILIMIVFAGVFICGHYLSIYYVFSTDYVVKGNIINYLWPLFYFVLSTQFIKNKKSKSYDFIFVFFSFVGAMLVISADTLSLTFSNNKMMLVLSLFAAFSASLYILLSGFIQKHLIGSFMFFSLPLMSTIFLLLPFHMFLNISNIRIEVVLVGLYLGFFSIFTSNILWILATSKNSKHSFSSLAYFVPVFSIFMVIYFNNLSVNKSLYIGLFFIVFSNILLHYDINKIFNKIFRKNDDFFILNNDVAN